MRVEVLSGVERRRRWSRDEKMRIIEETLAGGSVGAVHSIICVGLTTSVSLPLVPESDGVADIAGCLKRARLGR